MAQLHANGACNSGTSSIADDRRLATAEASWTNDVAFCASAKCETPTIKDVSHSPAQATRDNRDATLHWSLKTLFRPENATIHWIVLGKGGLSFIYFKQTTKSFPSLPYCLDSSRRWRHDEDVLISDVNSLDSLSRGCARVASAVVVILQFSDITRAIDVNLTAFIRWHHSRTPVSATEYCIGESFIGKMRNTCLLSLVGAGLCLWLACSADAAPLTDTAMLAVSKTFLFYFIIFWQ